LNTVSKSNWNTVSKSNWNTVSKSNWNIVSKKLEPSFKVKLEYRSFKYSPHNPPPHSKVKIQDTKEESQELLNNLESRHYRRKPRFNNIVSTKQKTEEY